MPSKWFRLSISVGDENCVERPFRGRRYDFFGIGRFDLDVGKRIEQWNPKSSLRSHLPKNDGDPDDVLGNTLMVPIFSARLRKALQDAGVASQDIQYLPVKVFQSTGEEIKGFAIANVVSRIAALDRERSIMLDVDQNEIDPLTKQPDVTGIWNAALREEAVQGHDMIRLLEYFPPIFVSERFAKVFRKGKFTGATLRPAGWHWQSKGARDFCA